jgi:hypothetical protein
MAEECVVRKACKCRFRAASDWKAMMKNPVSLVDFKL